MNQQPFNNEQAPGQTPPNQLQTPAGVPPNPSPFEQPMGQAPAPQPGMAPAPQNGGQQGGFEPNGMEPMTSPKSSWGLIIALVIILFVGVLIFASWQGWISLGGLEKLWKKDSTAATTTATTTSAVNTNDATRKSDLAALKAALTKYYQATGSYPIAATVQKTSDVTTVLSALVPTYIAKLPMDPLNPTYYYGYTSDGKTYTLTAVLEDKTDPAGIQSGTLYLYKVTDLSTETPTTAAPATTGATQ